ncbi:MAG: DUF2203 family protein [Gaiellaceae bacterium]
MPQHFTPAEANEALEEIRPLVAELVAHRAAQQRAQAERTELATHIAGNGGGIDAQQLADLEAEDERERVGVARCVNAIHGRGAIVKDVDEGLVDFPAQRDGEEILLCWRLGEVEVAYWHDLEEGFAGRRPLDNE